MCAIITTVDRLVHNQAHVFARKESFRLTGGHDLPSGVMVTLFGLFAEIEHELLSLRTKETLAAARRAQRPPRRAAPLARSAPVESTCART